MNPDECKKAFEAWWNGPNERGRRANLIQDRYDDALAAWQAAWNSRTESKPVTREWALKVLSDQLLSFEARVDKVLDALQLSAPQSPVVPSGVIFQHGETGRTTFIPLDEADSFEKDNLRWVRVGEASLISNDHSTIKQSPVVPGVPTEEELHRVYNDWHENMANRFVEAGGEIDYMKCEEWGIAGIHAHLLAIAHQNAPVAPGVEKLDQLYDEIMLATDANASTVIGWAHRIKAIHAHLLATSGHSSRVDLGWVRSLLLNMKPSEIDDTARLIFDTIATGGHQSREDRYREAIQFALDDHAEWGYLPRAVEKKLHEALTSKDPKETL